MAAASQSPIFTGGPGQSHNDLNPGIAPQPQYPPWFQPPPPLQNSNGVTPSNPDMWSAAGPGSYMPGGNMYDPNASNYWDAIFGGGAGNTSPATPGGANQNVPFAPSGPIWGIGGSEGFNPFMGWGNEGLPPSMTGQGTPWGFPNPFSQFGPIPQPQGPGAPGRPGFGSSAPMGGGWGGTGAGIWASSPQGGLRSGDGTQYGGVSTVNPQADAMQYGEVQQFSDAAHEQARRYLDPLQEQENRALDQQLINQGIDPRSEYGQFMREQLSRTQADANSKAAFDALGFGTDIQQQMFDQSLGRSQLAGDMQRAAWETDLGYAGLRTDEYLGNLGYSADLYGSDVQRYLGDLGYESDIYRSNVNRYASDLGHSLGMGRLNLDQVSESNRQMMDLERLGLEQWMLGEGARRFDLSTILGLAGWPGAYAGPGQTGPAGQIGMGGGNPWDYYLGGYNRATGPFRG